jgi:oligopeptide transport system permease protein
VQYLLYLKGIFTFDFGMSFSGRPVSEVLVQAFPITAKLASMALVIEAVFGIGFGLIAGLRKGKLFDSTVLVVSLVIIAVPIFVIGFLAQFFIGIKWGWVPPTVGGNTSFTNLLLPAFVLGAVSFAYVVRLTRTSVAENLSADFVRTATAKGLSRNRVVNVHVLRNSLIPVVTFLGADLASLMGGAIITEGIFNINGVGGTIYQAVIRGEAPTVVSFVTVLIVVYLVANLIVDLLYAALDPRIRYV